MNQKYMQFGIWTEDLSIDEQMVPYFGRHSCKMFIRGKPIRFGYKLFDLCSSSGYLYYTTPYAGAAEKYDKKLGLGADTIMKMVDLIEYPQRHRLFFDNFFSSHRLLCLLKSKQLRATGTIRSNRVAGAPLKSGKNLPKGNNLHFNIRPFLQFLLFK